MRLRAIVFALAALGGAGALAWGVAGEAARQLERRTALQLTEALSAAGQNWARVEVDGLGVTLTGTAPDETGRFRAREVVRQVAGADRVTDRTRARAEAPQAAPDFALELLRNEAEVSLIGLVPAPEGTDPSEGIRAALARDGLGGAVTDMLETAAWPEPEGWVAARDLALDLLGSLPRAKVSVAPGRVAVTATAETDAERQALEARLAAAAPAEVALDLRISAPRPVIAPFAVNFTLQGGAARLDTCAADSAGAAATIAAAARRAGLGTPPDCAIGLGAPAPAWAAAVASGIDAVAAMGGGGFAVSDLTAVLSAPEGVEPERLAELSDGLEAALPEVFSLTVLPPEPGPAQPAAGTALPPLFQAILLDDGSVRLSGPVRDATSRDAIASFTAALFGHDRVTDATLIDPGLPDGWPGRVLAGVEALSRLEAGEVKVTPEAVALQGWSLMEDVEPQVEALLAAKVGGAASIDVRYDAEKAAIVVQSPPELCVAAIDAILEERQIGFAAGSAEIEPSSRGVLEAIADVLGGCPGAEIEIGGHTDAQGAAEVNQRLSEARAEAVRAALEPVLPLVMLSARGYGAELPIADNSTPDGRAQNRRIAFTLALPVEDAPEPAEPAETAEAGGPEALADAAWPPAERPRPRQAIAEAADDPQ